MWDFLSDEETTPRLESVQMHKYAHLAVIKLHDYDNSNANEISLLS